MDVFNSVLGIFSHDIGIDLGTANTLVSVKGLGVIISEPSVVAVNKKTGEILAVGSEARRMVGRTPAHIVAIRPLRDGVISDFESTKEMIQYFIQKVHQQSSKFFKIPRPRVVIGIPSSVTEVEKRAVVDAAIQAGARKAYIIEEPMAAAIGAGLPVTEATGSMIVDIGGGTTDIAVISMGGIVVDKSLRVAGDEMDQDIVNYVRHKYNMLIGDKTAEDIKISIGSAFPSKDNKTVELRGRDLLQGLPKFINISSTEIREAISNSLGIIVESIKDAIEETPPELLSDIADQAIVIAGGGALIPGIEKYIADKVRMPVRIAADPLTCVVRGTEIVIEDIDLLSKFEVDKDEFE
jgi:rod shape-determining protein MreB